MVETPEGVRLQRYLAQCGVASRREAERLIQAGRVHVDGREVRELGTRVLPGTPVSVDGRSVQPEARAPLWVMLHKTEGTTTTLSDPHAALTLAPLVAQIGRRVFPVGRLDRDSSGLLLLTDDGEAAARLLHPRHKVPKRYRVRLRYPLEGDALARLRAGLRLEDGHHTQPCEVRQMRDPQQLTIVLREGHKRQIRLMLRAVGSRVERLHRTHFGPLSLGNLARDSWRPLRSEESEALYAAIGLRV